VVIIASVSESGLIPQNMGSAVWRHVNRAIVFYGAFPLRDMLDLPLLTVKLSILELSRGITDSGIPLRVEGQFHGKILELFVQGHLKPTFRSGRVKRIIQRGAPVSGISEMHVPGVIDSDGRKPG
jgi:hypothetical protein